MQRKLVDALPLARARALALLLLLTRLLLLLLLAPDEDPSVVGSRCQDGAELRVRPSDGPDRAFVAGRGELSVWWKSRAGGNARRVALPSQGRAEAMLVAFYLEDFDQLV